MTGEVAVYGVFVPTLLIIGVIASVSTLALMRAADRFGFYRLVTYRALVDLALYVIVFGAVAILAPLFGFAS
ncbi:DUF1656 domain-containing protein [Croceicoccus gelatinilyticus]|uniref:DUF1656 domain-containing protein n=1 Tax=Croceicoccus gelatinilyticus TaxID=2835536 RepID=UPI001BCDA836|nr:DUF1656 domain-containing protein [Croceicoccus gelatinilyticus]MBS7671569.1 DUF1656 domain-containing protein [Croceicoccus gelatinilyticus]